MVKFNIKMILSERMAYALDILEQKSGIDYTNQIRQAIREYIKRELTDEEKKMIDDFIKKWKKINKEMYDRWLNHLETLDDNKKILIDKIINIGARYIDQKGEILPGDLELIPEWDELTDFEQVNVYGIVHNYQWKKDHPDGTQEMNEILSKKNIDKMMKEADEELKKLHQEFDKLSDEEVLKRFKAHEKEIRDDIEKWKKLDKKKPKILIGDNLDYDVVFDIPDIKSMDFKAWREIVKFQCLNYFIGDKKNHDKKKKK